MKESSVPLTADGIPFRYLVAVMLRAEPVECDLCNGVGKTGTGWLDDDVETCFRCNGQKTVNPLRHAQPDPELEEHLLKCMDEFITKKYVRSTKKNVPDAGE